LQKLTTGTSIAASSGYVFVGKMSFGDNDVTEQQRTAIVNGIRAGLPEFVTTPRFAFVEAQQQLKALLVKFSNHDEAKTDLELAQGAWDGIEGAGGECRSVRGR
jgi:hypothetical protein